MSRQASGITTITAKRQLTLPAAVVRKLDLHPGDQLSFSLEEGAILATPLTDQAARRDQLLKGIKRCVRRGAQDDKLVELIMAFADAGGEVEVKKEAPY